MNCSKCGIGVNEKDRFCEACGNPLCVSQEIGKKGSCNCPLGQCKADEEGYCENCGIRCVSNQEEEVVDNDLAMISNVGRRHPTNEDSGTVCRGENNAVLIVADGVSSSIDAINASKTAVQVMKDILVGSRNPAEAKETMYKAIEAAHKAVMALSSTDEDYGPETTVVSALQHGNQLVIGWIGDSRAYLIDHETEALLTVDDSWIEEVVKSGEFTRERALADKRAHYVTQVVGMKDDTIDIHVLQTTIDQGKTLLLCTDGLWNYFPQEDSLKTAVYNCLESAVLPICDHLVKIANQLGGHDNITVAILKIR